MVVMVKNITHSETIIACVFILLKNKISLIEYPKMKSEQISKPYVVSGDVEGLMRRWSTRQTEILIPSATFFADLQEGLKDQLGLCFDGGVVMVSEERLRHELREKISQAGVPIVSMDRAYIDEEAGSQVRYLESTRAVNSQMEDVGLIERNGYGSVDDQIRTLSEEIKTNLGTNELCLVDDVIFSGGCMEEVIRKFEKQGMRITRVIVGVGVDEGLDKLEQMGIEVDCVERFAGVIDEICERDFYAGVPLSGRCVLADNGDVFGAPYFLPFGNPEKWASIPTEKVVPFSRFCVYQSKLLWREVEICSNRIVRPNDLPRRVDFASVNGGSGMVSVVDLLDNLLIR
jgi:hypothetical protein